MAQGSALKITTPQLYDLDADPGQHHDVSAQNPEIVKRLLDYAKQARADLRDGLTQAEGSGRRPPGRIDGAAQFPGQLPKSP